MIYGFAYLFMVLAITAGWIFLAVIPKPEFIQKPLNKLIDIIRPFLSPNREEDNELNL
tara:strand:+ start:67 stop:240 length:174 start_codon:yes stop_codon:yes gene_type:complete